MAESLLIDVIVSLPLNKSYTYKTPRNLKIGSIVKVPFGHNNEKINAVTISNGYKKKTFWSFQISDEPKKPWTKTNGNPFPVSVTYISCII